jgi:hypothetical protein
VRRWRAKVAQLTMRQVSFLFHMAFLLWGVRIGLVYSCSQCSQFGHGILWKQICGPIELCLWIVQVADELVSESTNPDSPRISPDQVLYHPASNNERLREKVKLIVWEVDLTAVDLIAGSWL